MRTKRSEQRSGQVIHLKTEFSFNGKSIVSNFIDRLHPSSAICGKPREKAMVFIKENEPHNRKLYTGYLGYESDSEMRYFVNLRCMEIHKHTATLYLGGGITKQSILENEWKETEDKAQSLLRPLEKMKNFANE